MSGAGPVDFVPAACEALQLANCIVNRDCQLADLDVEASFEVNGLFQLNLDKLVQLQIEINALDACIFAAVVQAFLKAGCPVPTAPSPVDVPDFQDCIDGVTDQATEATAKLGHLQNTFNVTFNDEGIPVRVQS